MAKVRVKIIEVVRDKKLAKREREVTEKVRRLFPDCGPIRLYRTANGNVGFQTNVAVTMGDRKRLDQLYRAVMRAVGAKRGRPVGAKTVQTKLHLPKSVYVGLKRLAEESQTTMSAVVADSLAARLEARTS
jgi:hypothetical protein